MYTSVPTRLALLVAACLLILAPVVARASHPAAEVQVDAGYLVPQGELGDGFADTPLGFGADPGFEVGFLWRYRFNLRWSLATAFHFARFAELEGHDETAGDFTALATSYRYGLQLRRQFGNAGGWQPFLVAGAGVFRDRFAGRDKILLEPLDRSVSTLGYTFQAGLRKGFLELGAVWSLNRFSSWRFFAPEARQDYNWDTVSVRFSWLIPGS